MPELLVSVDVSEVSSEKLGELKVAIKELVDFVDRNEPRPISYAVYLNADETQMTVIQVHPDSASMELHMEIAGPVFPKFKDLLQIRSVEVYGTPGDTLLDLLRKKAEMLGTAAPVVHALHAGFARIGVSG